MLVKNLRNGEVHGEVHGSEEEKQLGQRTLKDVRSSDASSSGCARRFSTRSLAWPEALTAAMHSIDTSVVRACLRSTTPSVTDSSEQAFDPKIFWKLDDLNNSATKASQSLTCSFSRVTVVAERPT